MQLTKLAIGILSIVLVSFNALAADKVVKTFDGHRVTCQNEKVEALAQEKAILVKSVGANTLEISLVKCTQDGWVVDAQPNVERVDDPRYVSYAIYQYFKQYNLYVVKNQKLIAQVELKELLNTGKQVLEISGWDPASEIFVNTVTEKRDEQGRVIDEAHYESFGSFLITQQP